MARIFPFQIIGLYSLDTRDQGKLLAHLQRDRFLTQRDAEWIALRQCLLRQSRQGLMPLLIGNHRILDLQAILRGMSSRRKGKQCLPGR
ncbi:hypothetical protein D3C81_1023690 [compost metagenome]